MGVCKNPLEGLELFSRVPPATLEKLSRAGTVRTCEKGQVLMRSKETVHAVWIQLTGKSMVYSLTHDGRRKIVFIFGRGALLNEHVLDGCKASLFCEMIEKGQVFVVPVPDFLACMEQDFALTRAVLAAQEKKIWRMGHQLKNTMGGIYMERKLAAKLWKLCRDFGRPVPEGMEIDVNLSVTFLADLLGAPRETTSRLCSTLADAGLIAMRKKRIIVVEPDQLAFFYKTGKIL